MRRFYIKDEHFNFDASKRPALDVNQMFRCPQADIELRLKKYSRIFKKVKEPNFLFVFSKTSMGVKYKIPKSTN